jgi:hypothetical protein
MVAQNPKQRSSLMIEYARDRLLSSVDLYSTGEHQLALSTLMKAEIYLGRAAEELLKTRNSGGSIEQNDLRELLDAIDIHIQTLQSMKESFTDAEKVQCDQLLSYTMIHSGEMICMLKSSCSGLWQPCAVVANVQSVRNDSQHMQS